MTSCSYNSLTPIQDSVNNPALIPMSFWPVKATFNAFRCLQTLNLQLQKRCKGAYLFLAVIKYNILSSSTKSVIL